MALRSIEALHIGDVHYPDTQIETIAASKDATFPPAVAQVIQMPPLRAVARKIAALVEHKPDVLLFTGDITTRGNVSGYQDCLKYLNELLNFRKWGPERLHVVPGNHDVERFSSTSSTDLSTKFSKFDQAWRDLGLPVLAVGNIRETTIPLEPGSKSGARIFSINSSLGCGEKRMLPAAVATELHELLEKYRTNVDETKAFELLGETLDTPAFEVDKLDEICQLTQQTGENFIPVLVTHHNLLPQTVAKVAMYTELLNAGTMRSRLSKLQRPLLYCHGHIHDYPIETVSSPEWPGSKVISISAPTLSTGFNWIKIEYSSRDIPLGCIVDSYRISDRDWEVRAVRTRVPFYSSDYGNVRRSASSNVRRILATMPEEEIMRFDEVAAKTGLEGANIEAFVDSLLEGEWLGVLQLEDRDEGRDYWRIRKVIR